MSGGTYTGTRSFAKIVTVDGRHVGDCITREHAEEIALKMFGEFMGSEQERLPSGSTVNVDDDEDGTTVTVYVRYA